jgi:hypothetical protein
MKTIGKFLLSLLMVTSIALGAKAQETTSEIQGIVLSGKTGIAGVTIVAIHEPTGTKYTTSTRQDGRYNFTNVKIGGPYSITASFVGFKTETANDINLTLGQAHRQNFTLTETSNTLKEVVVRSGSDRVFSANRTGGQETINRKLIEGTPTTSRSWRDITKLVPSANGTSFQGISSQLNNITVDGANFNNSFGLASDIGGQTSSNPISLDAIEQIQINTSPFDVKYGGFNGAGINTVTRSGKNQTFGSVYEYFRNKDWQSYDVGSIKLPKQDFTYDLKGFTVGGAIIKNKLFFFINGEQESNTVPGTPWVAASANNVPNGTTVSTAKASDLDALATFLKTKYNFDPGPYQGYSYSSGSKRLTAKIDWNINANNTFTIKYNYLKSFSEIPPSNSGALNTSIGRRPGVTAMPFYGAGYVINNNANVIIAELNTRFSNSANNKLQVGYTQLRDFRSSLSSKTDFPLVDILDGSNNPFTSFGYEQFTYNNKLNTDVFQLNDVFTKYIGNHEITLGTQNSFKKYANGFSPAFQGVYRFNSLADFYASAEGTKAAVRYDLSYTLGGGEFPLVGPKSLELGVFLQDKWKIKDNFTVSYGVRADYTQFYNTFLYNPVVDTLTRFYNGIRANTGAAPNTAVQISPRIGYNWDVFSDQTLQFRGGTGLFQGAPPFVWISNQASNSGMALFGQITDGTGFVFSPDVNAYRPTLTGGLSRSYNINVADPNYKFPQVWKTTLGADKKLFGFTITVEATHIRNINATVFQNIVLPSTGLITLVDGRTRYPSTSVYPNIRVGGVSLAGNTPGNPAIGNAIYMTNANVGYVNTLFVQVQRTFKNLFVSAAYNYQEAKDATVNGSTASTMWGSKPVFNNSNAFTQGYSNNYLPHRFIAQAIYKLEYLKHYSTSFGIFAEVAPNYTTSYIYANDLNNDGFQNDLMYIPRNATEIALTNAPGDTRTQQELWSQLSWFIDNNPYLSKNRGQIAQRNAVVLPWTGRVDLNITQDVTFNVKGRKQTLRFTADIYNFTNLLSKNLGVYDVPTTTTPLNFTGNFRGNMPIFTFPYFNTTTRTPLQNSWRHDTGNASRYQVQLGVRYIF